MSIPSVMRSFLFILLQSILLAQGSKILLLPIQMHSHVSDFVAIGKELIKNGHEVYTVSYDGYLEVDKTMGIKTIKLPCHDPKICKPMALKAAQDIMTEIMFKYKGDASKHLMDLANPIVYARQAVLEEGEEFFAEVHKLNFDLVFVDGLFMFRWYFLIPHRLGLPYVTLSDVLDPIVTRQPWLPSFVPHMLLATSDKMTFIERIKNVFLYVAFYFGTFLPPLSPNVLEQYRKYGDFDNLEELESRSLLFLQNSDELLDFPKPLMPNVVNIGGLTVKQANSLPQEHLEYAERSTEGLIIVSFGSGVKHLPLDIAQKMILAFSRVKENIMWRFENIHNLTIPKNVKLSNWLPQNDYMAHQNVKLFITHCGKNGVYESLYHGKPMIGMPLHFEQKYNAAVVNDRGYGLSLAMFDFSSEELYSCIREVIDNPTFRKRVQKASGIFKSRRDSPAERAAYWVEHVVKFGGNHLRSHALDMPFYQFMMLDILLTFIACGVLLVLVLFISIRCICNCVCKSKRPVISDEKKIR